MEYSANRFKQLNYLLDLKLNNDAIQAFYGEKCILMYYLTEYICKVKGMRMIGDESAKIVEQ